MSLEEAVEDKNKKQEESTDPFAHRKTLLDVILKIMKARAKQKEELMDEFGLG